jgi:hypothetical protein
MTAADLQKGLEGAPRLRASAPSPSHAAAKSISRRSSSRKRSMKAVRTSASPARGGLHGAGKAQELGIAVIDDGAPIVRRASFAERILGLVERLSREAAEHQRARESDGAKRLEPIGILHDLRFDRPGLDPGGKAVRLDGMRDSWQPVRPATPFRQQPCGLRCREPGRLLAQWGIFRQRHKIVKPRGRNQDLQPRPFARREMSRIGDDALDVPHIVRGIIGGHPLTNERGTARFQIRQCSDCVI